MHRRTLTRRKPHRLQAVSRSRSTHMAHLVTLLVLFFLHTVVDARTLTKTLYVSEICPMKYVRHSLEGVASGALTPYLYGGIYNRPNCTNCESAYSGIWPSLCGVTPIGVAHYDRQICHGATIKSLVTTLLQQEDTGALTMTPCDLWKFMRGRTAWIIG